jgi:hypothetical protein
MEPFVFGRPFELDAAEADLPAIARLCHGALQIVLEHRQVHRTGIEPGGEQTCCHKYKQDQTAEDFEKNQ